MNPQIVVVLKEITNQLNQKNSRKAKIVSPDKGDVSKMSYIDAADEDLRTLLNTLAGYEPNYDNYTGCSK